MITFSVVTITYNAASVLQPTLDSVLMQDYPHVEHIMRMGISYVFKASQTKDFMTQ